MTTPTEQLMGYIAERRATQVRREAGGPRPWTADPVLASKKFCCVIRDDDRTSRDAQKTIQGFCNATERMGATLSFRLYNRVETLRALHSAGVFSRRGEGALEVLQGLSPALNTAAYKISVKGGLFNIEGIAQLIRQAVRRAADFEPRQRAELTCSSIRGAVGCGTFLSYQIMQDVRWLTGSFSDEKEWCAIGLGALRGLARLSGQYEARHWTEKQGRGNAEEEMYARDLGINIRLQERGDLALPAAARRLMEPVLVEMDRVLPGATMFDLEHNLCEWDKYERIKAGEGTGRNWEPRS